MIQAQLLFLHDHPNTPGILRCQSEMIILQRPKVQPITFDDAWKMHARNESDPKLNQNVAPYTTRKHEQPFM